MPSTSLYIWSSPSCYRQNPECISKYMLIQGTIVYGMFATSESINNTVYSDAVLLGRGTVMVTN